MIKNRKETRGPTGALRIRLAFVFLKKKILTGAGE